MRLQSALVSWFLNILTALFLSAALGVIAITIALLAGALTPPAALVPRTVTPLRALSLPSVTPTPTSTPTPTFSLTPSPTATPTATFSPSPTPTASPTASATLTPRATYTASLTATPTVTATPTQTLTFTPTYTPTLAFPFILLRTTFTRFQSRDDCAFQGLSGAVFGLQQERLTARVGIQVQVTGKNFTQRVPIESDSIYGWVIQVGERPRRGSYRVQLLSREDVILSPAVTVQFDGNCERNLAQVDFTQIRPF